MKIKAIGSKAKALLGQARSAAVAGSSQRGVFLRLDNDWMIFISQEAYHGPLTLNLEEESGFPESLAMGTAGLVTSQGVTFREAGLMIETGQSQVWSAPTRPELVLPADQRKAITTEVLEQAWRIRPTPSLAALRAMLAKSSQEPEGEARYFFPCLTALFALPADRIDLSSVEALLGLGSGLTPSGDDILLGMLLALNRWGEALAPGLDLAALNQFVLAQAYARTTLLSTNLVACATEGQADERLLTALDGLLTGIPRAGEAASLLARWGSSSGLDALCGMALWILKAR